MISATRSWRGRLVLCALVLLAAASALWLASRNDTEEALSQASIDVSSDAIQTYYQDGVPHTNRAGNPLLEYQPGSSFIPIGSYYILPCLTVPGFSWAALEDPDFDGDGDPDWDGSYQLRINLGTSYQQGDRIQLRSLNVPDPDPEGGPHTVSQLVFAIPADTDLYYRVSPNPWQLYEANNPPLADGTFNRPCPGPNFGDPNPIATLLEGGFNAAIMVKTLHPQIFIDLKNQAAVDDFALVVAAQQGSCNQDFPEQLFAPVSQDGQGYGQNSDIYGWHLEDEPLMRAASPTGVCGATTSCDPGVLGPALEECIGRLQQKYDDHKDETEHVIFHVEAPPNLSGICDPGQFWEASVSVGDAANHDNYINHNVPGVPLDSTKPVADTMARQTNAVSELDPSWFTAQAFSNGDSGFRTPQQNRATVYTAIVHGATGIWYFLLDSQVARGASLVGVGPAIQPDLLGSLGRFPANPDLRAQGEAQWEGIVELNAELAALEPVILHPTTSETYEVFVSLQTYSWPPIRTMLKMIGSDYYLIAVNMDNAPTDAEFRFQADFVGAEVLFEGRQPTTANNVLSDHFEPFDVHVYKFQLIDGDGDGISDSADNCPITPNPGQEDTDQDGLGDACEEAEYGTNPNKWDTDGDGCGDGAELGPDETRGGRRDPTNFWDFYDTWPRDRAVSGLDFFAVLARFNAEGDPGIDPLSTPPPPPAYHTAFDRSTPEPGADPWDLGPPDGAISGLDFFMVLNQFNHQCDPPP